jgi:hypothetical protein
MFDKQHGYTPPQQGFAPPALSIGANIASKAYGGGSAPPAMPVRPDMVARPPMQAASPGGIASLGVGDASKMDLAKMIRMGTPEQKASAMEKLKGTTGGGGGMSKLPGGLQEFLYRMMGMRRQGAQPGQLGAGVRPSGAAGGRGIIDLLRR